MPKCDFNKVAKQLYMLKIIVAKHHSDFNKIYRGNLLKN